MATPGSLFASLAACFFIVTSSLPIDDVSLNSSPSIVNFLGVGYNILSGNPDGGDVTNGEVDPGLLMTRRILDMTYGNGELSLDGRYQIPDQVTVTPRDSCTQDSHVFHNTRTYQEKQEKDVELDDYQSIRESGEKKNFVYYGEESVCSLGEARYKNELAEADRFPLSRSFVIDACALPAYSKMADYRSFLDKWGTGVVVEVEVGTKFIKRFRSSDADFVKHISKKYPEALKSGGGYEGYSSSVVVDIDAISSKFDSSDFFGEHSETLHIGGHDRLEPIRVKVIGIQEIFTDVFWQLLDEYVTDGLCDVTFKTRMTGVRNNIRRALEQFAGWNNAQMAKDPVIQVPLTWPYGTYTLPMPKVGCPVAHFYWRTGSRFQDTEKYLPNNYWSDPCHLQGPYHFYNVEQNFCSKTVPAEDDYDWEWPQGEYCILKKGTECPSGFDEGWVLWDDSDVLNSNRATGELPEGEYDRDTLMYFCCREDGSASTEVFLPTDDNFFLYQKASTCQQVFGMSVNEEFFRWDGEDDRVVLRDYVGGSTPYNTGEDSDHKIHYCYYYTGEMD
ncbi:uncharacterized protein LOC129278492 isoform X2 [Lytechinus pictus]|uniref:uncharacterized protein LOC129278492 isoform X2 n=1 Tax=Lytechinus pictus TaxID=7653 RepID=UPI0030BA12C0